MQHSDELENWSEPTLIRASHMPSNARFRDVGTCRLRSKQLLRTYLNQREAETPFSTPSEGLSLRFRHAIDLTVDQTENTAGREDVDEDNDADNAASDDSAVVLVGSKMNAAAKKRSQSVSASGTIQSATGPHVRQGMTVITMQQCTIVRCGHRPPKQLLTWGHCRSRPTRPPLQPKPSRPSPKPLLTCWSSSRT
jgi:hypothetical protein